MDKGKHVAVSSSGEKSPRIDLKHAWDRFFKSECDLMKELGVQVDDESKANIEQHWEAMPLTEKCKWVEIGDDCEVKVDTELSGNSKFGYKCRPDRFAKMVRSFGQAKINAANDTGFGNLLRLKFESLKVNLISWLLERVDPVNRVLDVHGEKYSVGVKEFEEVMGIRDGETDVDFNDNGIDITKLLARYCNWVGDRSVISWSALARDIKGEIVDENFQRSFALYAIGTVLCPPSRHFMNPSFLYSVVKIDEIVAKKWATYCMRVLMEGIQKFKCQKLKCLPGCLWFLQLFYLQRVASNKGCVDSSLLPMVIINENVAEKMKKHPPLESSNGDTNEKVKIGNGGSNEQSTLRETCVLEAVVADQLEQRLDEVTQGEDEKGANEQSTVATTPMLVTSAVDRFEQLQDEIRQVGAKVQGLRTYYDPLLADMMSGMAKLTSAISSLTDVVYNMQREITTQGSRDGIVCSGRGLSRMDSAPGGMERNGALCMQMEFQEHVHGQLEEQKTMQMRMQTQLKDLLKLVGQQGQISSAATMTTDTISLSGRKRMSSQLASFPDGPAGSSSSQKRQHRIAELQNGVEPSTGVPRADKNGSIARQRDAQFGYLPEIEIKEEYIGAASAKVGSPAKIGPK